MAYILKKVSFGRDSIVSDMNQLPNYVRGPYDIGFNFTEKFDNEACKNFIKEYDGKIELFSILPLDPDAEMYPVMECHVFRFHNRGDAIATKLIGEIETRNIDDFLLEVEKEFNGV